MTQFVSKRSTIIWLKLIFRPNTFYRNNNHLSCSELNCRLSIIIINLISLQRNISSNIVKIILKKINIGINVSLILNKNLVPS